MSKTNNSQKPSTVSSGSKRQTPFFSPALTALERSNTLVKKFDIPSLGGPAPVERAATTFLIYNPKYMSGDELISILCDFMQNLMASGVSDPGLFDTINNLKWIDKTSSLLVSGDQQSVERCSSSSSNLISPAKRVQLPPSNRSTIPASSSTSCNTTLATTSNWHSNKSLSASAKVQPHPPRSSMRSIRCNGSRSPTPCFAQASKMSSSNSKT